MKFILIGLVVLISAGYGGSKFYLHHKVSESVDIAVVALAPYATVRYGGISSTLDGELTVDDVNLQMEGFRDELNIGRIGITTPSYLALLKLSDMAGGARQASPELPEHLGLIAEDIRLPVGADYFRKLYDSGMEELAPSDIDQPGVQCVGKYGHSPRVLRALGYEELVVSVSTILRQAETLYSAEMNIDIDEMFDFEVDLKMAGSLMSAAIQGPGYRPQLTEMRMVLTDRSLNQRIREYCTELGLTPKQIQAAYLDSLAYIGENFGIEFDEYVIDPYKDFVAGKSTFIATARPRRPLYLSRIDNYAPADVPALLNLEAVAQ